METLFNKYGTDKSSHHGYHRYYEAFLAPMKDDAFNFVEIGFHKGLSMAAWREYFTRARIYSVDIDAAADTKQVCDNGWLLKGDQGNAGDLERLVKTVGTARVILDDGSHVPEHQILTFNILFTSLLEEGGVFIIEDVETSYWSEGHLYGRVLRYGRHHPMNLVSIFLNLVHAHLNKEFNTHAEASPISKEAMSQIGQITFGTNCILIRKKTAADARFFDRPYRFAHCLQQQQQPAQQTATPVTKTLGLL